MSDNDLRAQDFYQFKSFNGLSAGGLTGIGGTVRVVSAVHSDLYGFILHNNDAATRWVRIYYKPSADVTPGTTIPDLTIMLGASQSIALELRNPIRKVGSVGLAVDAATTETGSTAPTASVTGEILYKELKG